MKPLDNGPSLRAPGRQALRMRPLICRGQFPQISCVSDSQARMIGVVINGAAVKCLLASEDPVANGESGITALVHTTTVP